MYPNNNYTAIVFNVKIDLKLYSDFFFFKGTFVWIGFVEMNTASDLTASKMISYRF